MLTIRKSEDRGHADHGWLNSRHTFSFAGYRDPAHPHDNMEIISYVLAGRLEHRDSLGNGSVLTPGRFQRMSAGTGVTHSEFNPSADEPVHFYQIWLTPGVRNVPPSYQELDVPHDEKHNRLRLVASPDGAEGSLLIHQDARVFLADLDAGAAVTHELAARRHAWLQIIRGAVAVGDQKLAAGDAVAVSDEPGLAIRADQNAEVMLFDLA